MTVRKFIILTISAAMLASCSLNSRIQKADKKFALGEYYRAAEMYRSIYPQVPLKKRSIKAKVAYKMGNAYRIIENNKRAETAYKNAVKYGNKDSLVFYFYAEVLRSNGKYKEAIKMYEKQAETTGNSDIIKEGIASCNKALGEWKKHTRFVVTKEKVFNTRYSDFCPAFASDDADVLYFNSTRVARGAKKSMNSRITGQRNNQIYSAKTNVKGEWENPEVVEGIESEYDQGAVSFSSDFQTIYYTLGKVKKGETYGAAVYTSDRTGAAWSTPKELKVLKDSTITVAHPAIDNAGIWLYFVSDMEGTLGGKDIWRTRRDGDGWSVPQNLGPDINTAGDEMFPYFSPDGTLFFSSDGHEGLGGLDIFKAEYIESKDSITWVSVTNLMQPINSRYDDFGITVAKGGEWGYFSSNRGDRKNYDHIYKFELPKLAFNIEGIVTDNMGEPVGDAVVKLVGDNGIIANIKTKKNGTYTYPIESNANYLLLATCRGFLNSKQELNVEDLDKNKDYRVDFSLTSISKPVKMNNIFYEFGSAKLTKESDKGLNDLVKLLTDNPNITIEISSHTDYVGSEDANIKLSQERAKSVVDYLTSHGIDSERLTAVGYGESQPVVPDKAMVRANRFLKVNVPLTEEFIKTLKPELQETANQINRRTEFKVLKTTYKMF